MPLQNRVTPFGDIVAIPEHGTMMGNRGSLHDGNRKLGTRRWSRKAWVCCRLVWQQRHREIMAPGKYTELFFLDEATALAAGHRPCRTCRREDFIRFCEAVGRSWGHAPGRLPLVETIDEKMHADRIGPSGSKRVYQTRLTAIPDGAMFSIISQPNVANLRWKGAVWTWNAGGYVRNNDIPADTAVIVLTPHTTVQAISAGYVPSVHVSVV